jgi:hypothetical protein
MPGLPASRSSQNHCQKWACLFSEALPATRVTRGFCLLRSTLVRPFGLQRARSLSTSSHFSPRLTNQLTDLADSFFSQALVENISAGDMFRITTTSFMDAYNFDIRQLMKSCVHHVLPSGHLIPFDAYNVLYRDGHLPLPQLSSPPAAVTLMT